MSGKLETYRSKRSAQKTPEPMGEEAPSPDGRRFVVQEHHATRLHWDLRLEHDGVLVSFAIPNGLPDAPKDNRLAVHTEDHPLEYLEFEGEIPKGQYGARSMRVWDRGTYEVLKWEPRKIEVLLHGERVQGRYALFPIDKDENPKNWMIHRMDPPADAAAGEPMPEKIVPMMARTGTLPRDDEHWAFEVKWDGVRAVCHSEPGRMRLHSRNLLDITPRYPEVGRLNRALSHHRAVLDGEIVALDAEGRPSFGALQRRMHVGSESAVRRLAKETPVTYVIFDLLWLDGHSLMELPYTERRARLAELELGDGGRWRVPDYVVGHGAQLLEATEQQGLEGVIAKRLDSHLRSRAAHAVVAEDQEHVDRQEVVVGGWVPGDGKRRDRIGALLVGRARRRRLAAPCRARRHRLHGGRARSPGRDAAPPRARGLALRARRPEDPARRRLRRSRARGRGRVPRVDRRRPAARALLQGPARRQARRARRARGGQRRPGRGRRAPGQALEPRQGPLSRGRLRQARRHRLLRAHRARPSCRTSRAAR